MLRINQSTVAGAVLLNLKGELRAPEGDQLLIRAVRRLVQSGSLLVLLDLERVTDIDAAGLGALVSARNLVHDGGGRIVLLKPGRRIVELLSVTRLLSVFEVLGADARECRPWAHEMRATQTPKPSGDVQLQEAVLLAV